MRVADWCHATSDGVRLAVHVMPNAKKTEIIGVFDGCLKIRLHAPPVEGKANDELIRTIAKLTGQAKSKIELARGQSGRRKIVQIHAPGLDAQQVMNQLLADISS